MKHIFFVFLFIFFSGFSFSQKSDTCQTLVFEDESLRKPKVFKDGSQITIWSGARNRKLYGKLKILSDSSIAVGTDSIFLEDINIVKIKNMFLEKTGGKFMIYGGVTSGLGVLMIHRSLKKIEESTANIIYVIPLLTGTILTAIGPVISATGLSLVIIGNSKKLKIKSNPEVITIENR